MTYTKLVLLVAVVTTAVYLLCRQQRTIVVKEIQTAATLEARRQRRNAFMGVSR